VLRARDRETEILGEVLEHARGGAGGALVVSGEAGIGKTALLDWALDHAHNFRVLKATGAEFEMELAFASLHALCAPLLSGRERLPQPQREALEAAFGLRSGSAPDPLRAGMAVLTLLSDAAGEAPVVCVVDDAQWLDRASAQALAFAARRIGSDSVAMLFGVREPLVRSELVALPALQVGRLPDAEARALFLSVLNARLDEQVIDRIVAEARGNPLALRELAAGGASEQFAGGFGVALRERPDDALFRGRLESLPSDGRLLLLLAAAEPLGDPGLLWRAAEELGLGHAAAAPAEAAGLLEIGSRVRFRHPLVRSAVYRPASSADRQRVHAALAAVTDERFDPDRRAWHRAQAASGPDEEVAAELERSAERARTRGGMAAAAAFLERAVELTPDNDRRVDRTLIAAETHLGAGEPDAASDLLRGADPEALDPLHAAHVERLRGQIAFAVQRGLDAPPLLRSAAQRLEELDVRMARDAHLDALSAAAAVASSSEEMAAAAAVALSAPPAPEPPKLADLLLDGLALVLTGDRPQGTALLKRALDSSPADLPGSLPQVITIVCLELLDLDAYVTILSRLIDKARADGAMATLPQTLGPLSAALLVQGRVRAAEAMLEEAEALAAATGMPTVYPRVHLAALRGNAPEAHGLFDSVIADATARGETMLISYIRFCEAMLHNGRGDYATALAAGREPTAWAPLGWGLALRELVEAAVHAGDRGVAEEAFGHLRERAHAAGTDWGLGVEASSAALLAEGGDADELHRAALDHFERGDCGFELGRAELLYGEWLRRVGRRLEARDQLRAAHERLSAMGAEGFAERALGELRATGERARRRSSDTVDELTPQELHIARLVGSGATSKEVAAQLFLSPRTIDAHLRSIFRKLDITSRRQLRGMAVEESATAAGVQSRPRETA
jgi:DNA-binding CsgD family transcriptional regulator